MPKRHVYLPSRTVVVEDGTVRDLDGNTLGYLGRGIDETWIFRLPDAEPLDFIGHRRTQREAVAALLLEPSVQGLLGPNLFDRPR